MNLNKHKIHHEMYSWAENLFPICRSITGSGVRETLKYIKSFIPELIVHSVPSIALCQHREWRGEFQQHR